MNKDIKGMLKDASVLLAITVIAGLVLGVVYQVTKDPIAQQKLKQKQEACQEVFQSAASFEDVVDFNAEAAYQVISAEYPSQDIDEVVVAKDGAGNDLGYVITVTTHEGYGGDIQFSMGITKEGQLNGISILSISETAGLGMKAEAVLKPQFANKKVSNFTYTKSGATMDSQIDAISGATITTNAVTTAVNAGLYIFQTQLGGSAQ